MLQRESNKHPDSPGPRTPPHSSSGVRDERKTDSRSEQQLPHKKPLSPLIKPPINDKDSHLYVVHYSLYNHTEQAYTTEWVGM